MSIASTFPDPTLGLEEAAAFLRMRIDLQVRKRAQRAESERARRLPRPSSSRTPLRIALRDKPHARLTRETPP
jgi:hypothetical protein